MLDVKLQKHVEESVPLMVSLMMLKISHAPQGGNSNSQNSLPSDKHLSDVLATLVESFITVAHHDHPDRWIHVGSLLDEFNKHLSCLSQVDGMAPKGACWLQEISLTSIDPKSLLNQH